MSAALVTSRERPRPGRGLVYAHDDRPGIRRHRTGKGFAYRAANGTPLADPEELDRIRALAIPPAWRDVWICESPRGHIQATGRDARGRKQYIYHPRWHELRDGTKFHRMADLGAALPRLRRQVSGDLRRHGLGHDRVVAAVVALLESSLIRIGNTAYARDNGSFGLTTMNRSHLTVSGETLHFHFPGKSGKQHDISVRNPRAARVVKGCLELEGPEVFTWLDDDGVAHPVRSQDVNDYIRAATGGDFTAKDIRTWHASVLALEHIQLFAPPASRAELRRKVAMVAGAVAGRLGNTATVCRASYIHPAIFDAYANGSLARIGAAGRRNPALSRGEASFLRLLRQPPKRRPAASGVRA